MGYQSGDHGSIPGQGLSLGEGLGRQNPGFWDMARVRDPGCQDPEIWGLRSWLPGS